MKKCTEHEVEVPDQEAEQKGPGERLCKNNCQVHKLNGEDIVDRSRWRKLIKNGWWSRSVWVGECFFRYRFTTPSVLWRCWLGGRKGIRPVKKWVVGCWCGCLGWGADLHIAQQMPLPLTISCSSKSRLVLPFWYLLTRVVPDRFQQNSKTVVCVCVSVHTGSPRQRPLMVVVVVVNQPLLLLATRPCQLPTSSYQQH